MSGCFRAGLHLLLFLRKKLLLITHVDVLVNRLRRSVGLDEAHPVTVLFDL